MFILHCLLNCVEREMECPFGAMSDSLCFNRPGFCVSREKLLWGRKWLIGWRGVGGWQWNYVLLCSLLCYLVTHAGDKFLFLCHCLEESISFKEIYAHESYCHWNNLWKREYFICLVNLLKPTGYVMLQQFNIQQLYVLPTLYLSVVYLSGNKQRLVPLTA